MSETQTSLVWILTHKVKNNDNNIVTMLSFHGDSSLILFKNGSFFTYVYVTVNVTGVGFEV